MQNFTRPDTMSPAWRLVLTSARDAVAAGRFQQACVMLEGVWNDPAAPLDAFRFLANASRAAGKPQDAVRCLERLADRQPGSSVSAHNLAAALGDLGRMAESERAARVALARGGAAPETWLVLARALQGQGRLDDAEQGFRAALRIKPDYYPAHRDLAQLIWMRDADQARVQEVLEPLGVLGRGDPAALVVRAGVLKDTLGDQAAFDSLAPALGLPHPDILMAAAAAAAGFDPALALALTERAFALDPASSPIRLARLSALIASGKAGEAAAGLADHVQRDPGDQYARALLDAAWRILGDRRALDEEGYRRLVRVFDLEPDAASDEREAWLKRTTTALRALHPFKTHPFNQSVRSGAQSMIDPRQAGDPDIDRLFAAVCAPVDACVAAMGGGRREPASGAIWRMSGAWSVRLRAGGHHTDHVHPRAWISSAVHVETPPATEGSERAGWLRFGAARIGAAFSLPPQYWVEPRPGALVLFPSWLWHGTEPFSGEGERLTVAFDVEPA